MTEPQLWSTLISQAPGTAAVIVVVVLFLRAIKERDALFIEQMKNLTDEMKAINAMITEHDARVSEGMDSMYRAASRRKRTKKADE